MFWLNAHKHVLRIAILLLLLVALMGPWAFDLINVPAEFPCSPPFIRLEGDFCGGPLSGMRVFLWMVSGFIGMVGGFIKVEMSLADRGRDFLGLLLSVMILILLLLPFVSTLRQFIRRDLRDRQVTHVAVWGMAALSSCLILFESGFSRLHWALWGLWLYVGLAISALVVEVLLLTARRRAARDDEDSNTVEGR